MAAVSTRITNIETPINLLLAGPPGDGKTAMVLRIEHLAHVDTLSDTTYLGLIQCLRQIKRGLISTILVPDLGTLVGRRNDVARQAIATIAMMTAEGVRHVRVGKQVMDFEGARASFVSAITVKDLLANLDTLEQNAFLSRVLLVDFDLSWEELKAMLERKHRGDRSLLRPLSFRMAGLRAGGFLPMRPIVMAPTHAKKVQRWWEILVRKRDDRFFGFRSADFLHGMVQAAAYLRGDVRVRAIDLVRIQTRILPLVMSQIRIRPEPNR